MPSRQNRAQANRRSGVACDVVIPFHDNIQFVPAAVDSILNQRDAECYVHLIDDAGSADLAPLRELYRHHPNVFWYRNERNLGPYRSLHRAVPNLRTDFIAIQDSDDIARPDRIHFSVTRLTRSGCDIFAAAAKRFHSTPGDARFIHRSRMPDGRHSHNVLLNSTMVVRAGFFREINGFADYFCGADTEFVLRAYCSGAKFCVSKKIVLWKRDHHASLTRRKETGFDRLRRGKSRGRDWVSAFREAVWRENARRYRIFTGEPFDPRHFGCLAPSLSRTLGCVGEPGAPPKSPVTVADQIPALPPCDFRASESPGQDCFICTHPQLHSALNVVSADLCHVCELRVPQARKTFDRSITTWSVGITTAPRAEPTLARSLASLAAAGWERPRIFAEPGVEPPAEFRHLPVTRRDAALGAFPNWFLALSELVMREPRAEAYFLCQDDVLLSTGLRDYLERRLWPAARVGVVSVYCPSHYTGRPAPGFYAEDRGWDNWGALAFVFPNPSARALLSDPMVLNHRHHGPAQGLRNIDSVVGSWCRRTGLTYFVHSPSLVQHIGDTSSIFPQASNRGRRRAARFVEDLTCYEPPPG